MLDFLKDLWKFMKERKKWWLLPVVIALLILGLLLFTAGPATAPFLYTVF